MDLNPENLDRHPFRIRKRGYDIMQVRKLLREISEELRARQRVRDDLTEEAEPRVRAEEEAVEIVARAEAKADAIVGEARARVATPTPTPERSETEAMEAARSEAARILEEAESKARERSAVVIGEAQARLDRLMDRERDLATRLRVTEQRLRELSGPEVIAGGRDLLGNGRDRGEADVIELNPVADDPRALDNSFATTVKDAVRDEVGSNQPLGMPDT